MTIVGLTGSTGSGKSIISDIFAGHGFYIIDADETARRVTAPGSDCVKRIGEKFGLRFVDENGALKRRELGRLVFSSPVLLHELNMMLHPLIINEIKSDISECESEYILIDAPALIQSGGDSLCDIIIAAVTDEKTRIKRIMERDDLTEQQARIRVNAQPPDGFYTIKADYVIKNDAGIEALKEQAAETAKKIKA